MEDGHCARPFIQPQYVAIPTDNDAPTHVPHVDVPISAFGRCSGHPSRMAERPYAEIGPSKPCVAGVYLACRKTQRSVASRP